MSRVKTLALAIAVLFTLTGCAELFEFNLFGALDKPPTPTAADYQGSNGLDKLGEDLDSPAVVDAMTPAVVTQIEQDLWDTYLDTPPLSSSEEQQAAILYADLALKTSEGEALVNNIVSLVLGDLTIDSTTRIDDLLAAIIPSEAKTNSTVFAAMVNALLLANEAYLLLGGSIDQAAPFGEADPAATLPAGSLPGDIAQKAIVAYAMRAIVDRVKAEPPVLASDADAITPMFQIVNGTPCSFTLDAFAAPPDPVLALLDLAGVSVP
jgi:hypothetical protein